MIDLHLESVKYFDTLECLPLKSPVGTDVAHILKSILNRDFSMLPSNRQRDKFNARREIAFISSPSTNTSTFVWD